MVKATWLSYVCADNGLHQTNINKAPLNTGRVMAISRSPMLLSLSDTPTARGHQTNDTKPCR